jgi:hypothetical protein
MEGLLNKLSTFPDRNDVFEKTLQKSCWKKEAK